MSRDVRCVHAASWWTPSSETAGPANSAATKVCCHRRAATSAPASVQHALPDTCSRCRPSVSRASRPLAVTRVPGTDSSRRAAASRVRRARTPSHTQLDDVMAPCCVSLVAGPTCSTRRCLKPDSGRPLAGADHPALDPRAASRSSASRGIAACINSIGTETACTPAPVRVRERRAASWRRQRSVELQKRGQWASDTDCSVSRLAANTSRRCSSFRALRWRWSAVREGRATMNWASALPERLKPLQPLTSRDTSSASWPCRTARVKSSREASLRRSQPARHSLLVARKQPRLARRARTALVVRAQPKDKSAQAQSAGSHSFAASRQCRETHGRYAAVGREPSLQASAKMWHRTGNGSCAAMGGATPRPCVRRRRSRYNIVSSEGRVDDQS